MSIITIRAEQVQDGDSIPGLDNAYVIEVEENADIRGDYNLGLARDKTTITYNDAQGGEGYLILTPDTYVTVERDE